MKTTKILCYLSLLLIAISACESKLNDLDSDNESTTTPTPNENFTTNSQTTDLDNQIKITYFTDRVEIDNPYQSEGIDITETNQNVIINSTNTTTEFNYVVSGNSSSGSLRIYSEYKFGLVLNGLDLTSTDGSAINIQSKKKINVILVAETQNRLVDSENYTINSDEDAKACFFSEGQLEFSGTGTLNIYAYYQHAICSDDYIEIEDANIIVKTSVKDAIHTNDYFEMNSGTLDLSSTSDAIQCEEGYIELNAGTITINSGDEGIVASYEDTDSSIDPYIIINEGMNININTTGESAKGIKAQSYLTINGGNINIRTSALSAEGMESKTTLTINDGNIGIEAYDDCINAADHVEINGGKIYCYSQVDDAIDSNGTITITDGLVVAVGVPATPPQSGFDCDTKTYTLTGGTLLGLASDNSVPTASVSSQYSVIYGATATTGTLIHIKGTTSNEGLMTYLIPRNCNPMSIFFTSADMQANTEYSFVTGGTISNADNFHGLYLDGTYSGGSTIETFTTTLLSTQIGTITPSPGGGMGPGTGGPMRP